MQNQSNGDTLNPSFDLKPLEALWQAHWPKGRPRDLHYPFGKTTITTHLRGWARSQPDRPALIYYGRTWSFAELDRASDAFAWSLKKAGFAAGDRIGVFLPNCPQFVIAFLAILKLGAIHVPISPLFKEQELDHELSDCSAVAILVWTALLPLLDRVPSAGALKKVYVTDPADGAGDASLLPQTLRETANPDPQHEDFFSALAASSGLGPFAATEDAEAPAALNYTGGTTGLPKGCVHTQEGMLYTAASNVSVSLDMGPTDVGLCFYPVFWIAGEDIAILFPIVSGAACVLMARWDPVGVCAAIEAHRVTHVSMLVDNLAEILDHPETGNFDLTSLKSTRVSSFVRKLDPDLRRRWHQRTGVTVVEATWGMTETHSCDTFTLGLQDEDFDLKSEPVFVGLPIRGTQIIICDFDTRQPVPPGEIGEICVRSPSVMKGYWNKAEATNEILRGGWLFSGDSGRLDKDGFLHFLGRRKELIKVKGMSVFPAEIETCLQSHPAVARAGVIARPDAQKGQVPVAFVLLQEGAEDTASDELTQWCRDRLASYKTPDIRIVGQLPMTGTGKIQKHRLIGML